MKTEAGDDVNVYDYVPLHTIEEGDQVVINSDLIEVRVKIDSGEAVLVKGYSHISGDTAMYTLPFDTVVGLWTV